MFTAEQLDQINEAKYAGAFGWRESQNQQGNPLRIVDGSIDKKIRRMPDEEVMSVVRVYLLNKKNQLAQQSDTLLNKANSLKAQADAIVIQ